MRTLALIALLGMTGREAAPQYEHVHASTLVLKFGNVGCSGTAVGRYTILTATHCLFGDDGKPVKPATLKANGEQCEVWQMVNDGADHALLTVSCKFDSTAKLGREAKVGDKVFVWGSPVQFTDVLRFGTVAGYQDDAMPGLGRSTVYDFNGGSGDSGAAIFNKRGRIVGVVSIGSRGYVLMGSFPLRFTKAQLKAAGL